MTGLGTGIASAVATVALAVGGLLAESGPPGSARTALVIDAGLARDGRELIDPRLRELHAELRVARTPDEAATDLRYFASQGYRLLVAGPDSRAAARAAALPAATWRR